MPPRAVVVGGLGFLGAAVVRELVTRGSAVLVVDRRASRAACDRLFGRGLVGWRRADITDRMTLRSCFRRADEVYHFAGRLGTSELETDLHRAIEDNITGAVNVFEAAMRADVGRVFYPSKPNVWLNAYTITKIAAEQFAEMFSRRGLQISTLRYFNAYGPGQKVGPVRKIIPTFALQALRGEPLTVYGDGKQTVDMIYSTDLARVTIDIMRHPHHPEPLDLGRGVALTVNQVAADVIAHLDSRSPVHHLPMRDGETPGTRLVADITPLRRLLGDLAFADWSNSLSHTLEWYARTAA